ncbi:MAG: hypothetical protein K2X59_01240 [Sphingomonas sp.]|nr:hypothetical protein [Sphingomonas sp.]
MPFDLGRSGRFPHHADEVLGPVKQWLPGTGGAAGQLASAPLAAFPLWEEGARLGRRGETDRARRLIAEAVRRDPQLVEARLWLASDALQHRLFARALHQLDWLYTLVRPARPQIAVVLAQLAQEPGAEPSMIAFADRQPIWRQSVVSELMRSNAAPALIFRLLGGADGRAGSTLVGQSGLVATLVARGRYDQAYLAWVAALPASALPSIGYIYDDHFRQLPGALPFNWTLADSPDASVDFVKGGGLEISYFGEKPAHLLDQLLVLPPGRYRFIATAHSLGSSESSRIGWALVCGDDQTRLLGMADVPVAPKPVTRGFAFAVAADCPAQRLSLDGTPAEISGAAEMKIRTVRIVNLDHPG